MMKLAILRWSIVSYFLLLGLMPTAAYASDCPPDDPSRSDCKSAASTARSPLVPIAGAAAGAGAGWVLTQILGGATNVAPTIPAPQETTKEPDDKTRKDPCADELGRLNSAWTAVLINQAAVRAFSDMLYLLEVQYENTRQASFLSASIDAGFLAGSLWTKPVAGMLGRTIASQTLQQKLAESALKALGKELTKTLMRTMMNQGIDWTKLAEKPLEGVAKKLIQEEWKKDIAADYMKKFAGQGVDPKGPVGQALAKGIGSEVAGPLSDAIGNWMSIYSMGEGAFSGAAKLAAIRKQISEVRRKLYAAQNEYDDAFDAEGSARRLLEHCRKIWAK